MFVHTFFLSRLLSSIVSGSIKVLQGNIIDYELLKKPAQKASGRPKKKRYRGHSGRTINNLNRTIIIMDNTNFRGLTEEQIEHKLRCLEAELWENYGIIPEQIQVDEDRNELFFTAIEETGPEKNYIEDKYEALLW